MDFEKDYENSLVSYRVSVDDFKKYKDLYKDLSEIIARQLSLVAGINNMVHRGDFNEFSGAGKDNPRDLHKYADIPFGLKLKHIDDGWYKFKYDFADNKLRNAIAHYKTEYNDVTQIITYFPKREGIRQEKPENIYFLDFMRKILISYREMHGMHQLIKGLLYYDILLYRKNA